MSAPTIFNGAHLDDDLTAIDRKRGGHGSLINAFLDHVSENDEARWTMLRRDASFSNPHFNCDPVEFFQRQGYNIYRIRPLSKTLKRYRILYAYDIGSDELHLLAVVEKLPQHMRNGEPWGLYGYEPEHPVSKRTISEYDGCGFKRIPAT